MWEKKEETKRFSLTITYRERYFTSEAMKIHIQKNTREIHALNGLCLGRFIHVSRKTQRKKR